jgi:hypothetical protein
MDFLRETLERVLASYAGEMLNGYSYLTANTDQTLFAIVDVARIGNQPLVETSLVVRLEGNTIVIERDVNSKPLIDALLECGISRSQIVLASGGESTPAAA